MLFQKNILKKYIASLPEEKVSAAWEQYKSYFINNYERRERLLASTGSASGGAVWAGTLGHDPLSLRQGRSLAFTIAVARRYGKQRVINYRTHAVRPYMRLMDFTLFELYPTSIGSANTLEIGLRRTRGILRFAQNDNVARRPAYPFI